MLDLFITKFVKEILSNRTQRQLPHRLWEKALKTQAARYDKLSAAKWPADS